MCSFNEITVETMFVNEIVPIFITFENMYANECKNAHA